MAFNEEQILDDILALASELIRIPSVTVGRQPRPAEVWRASSKLVDFLEEAGLQVRLFEQGPYPAVLAGFPGGLQAPVMLSGHFDVVAPEPDDRQFDPHIDGDYLIGRGSADMKAVVATYLVWMRERLQEGGPYPPMNLLLIGNEETGEDAPMGTAHVLQTLAGESGYAPDLLVAGERTGERGDELWGGVCTANRGVVRFQIVGQAARGHSGLGEAGVDLVEQMLEQRLEISRLFERYFRQGKDGWRSQLRFPFFHVGQPGVYNVTADRGVLGVEIRPIPEDDLAGFRAALEDYVAGRQLRIDDLVIHPGIVCDPSDPYLAALFAAVEQASGHPVERCRKLAGTSARFAPGGRGVIWGQSGVGPHTRYEKHFIPSILPYYRALDLFARKAGHV